MTKITWIEIANTKCEAKEDYAKPADAISCTHNDWRLELLRKLDEILPFRLLFAKYLDKGKFEESVLNYRTVLCRE